MASQAIKQLEATLEKKKAALRDFAEKYTVVVQRAAAPTAAAAPAKEDAKATQGVLV